MTTIIIITVVVLFGVVFYLNRKDRAKDPYRSDYKPQEPSNLSRDEVTLIDLINKHRKKQGLNMLKMDLLACNVARTHCKQMVKDGVANHDNFPQRSFEMASNNSLKTGEVVASGLHSAKGFLNAYLKHKDKKGERKHKEILEGDFTHIGTSTIDGIKKFNVTILAKYK